MKELLKDKEHLVRVAGLFAAGLVLFLLARAVFVPKSFGEYGHYRGNALQDIRTRPLMFAGRAACEDCHADIVDARKGSKHARIGCEACHGPLAAHANDPDAVKPQRPNKDTICLGCHLENVARPAAFPQVDRRDHGEGQPCSTCHQPHHPEISAESGAAGAAAVKGARGSEVKP